MTFCLDSTILKPEDNKEIKNAVILLHGYGGDGKDISMLALSWKRHLPNTLFICPNGHEICQINPLGFQWFDLTNDDYNLLYNSPCIDAGSPNYIDPDTTISDMGAFYYNQNISGDLNNDNEINVLDVIIIINLILDNTYNSLADMNSDSVINVQDAIILISIILSD